MTNTLFAAVFWMVWPIINPDMQEKEYPIIEVVLNSIFIRNWQYLFAHSFINFRYLAVTLKMYKKYGKIVPETDFSVKH